MSCREYAPTEERLLKEGKAYIVAKMMRQQENQDSMKKEYPHKPLINERSKSIVAKRERSGMRKCMSEEKLELQARL